MKNTVEYIVVALAGALMAGSFVASYASTVTHLFETILKALP